MVGGLSLNSHPFVWFALAMVLVSICVLVRALHLNRSSSSAGSRPKRLRNYCHRAARLAGLMNAGTGAITFLGGWILDIPRLRTLAEGYSAMRPLTAVGLFFAGTALYLDREDQPSSLRRKLAHVCAAATMVVGLLPLIEYISLQNLRLDERLVSRELVTLVPGHMAFLAAVNFVIIGCVILLSRNRRGFYVGQYLALVAGTFSLFNTVGFLYGIHGFYGMTFTLGPVFTTAMAIHTAVAMVILSAGVMLSRPSWGLIATVTSSAPGGVMARRLLPCALIFPAAVGWLQMEGQAHELYDRTFGLTLFAAANIVIFMSLIWRSAGLLNRSDVERSRVEEHLRESDRSFRRLADAMPPMVWTATPDGNVDYYNQRWYDYTGMTLKQCRDWGWTPVLHPDDLQNCLDRWTASINTGALYEVEYRFKRAADGEYRWHLGRAVPMLDEHGKVSRWFGSCTDIHDNKRAQAAIRQLNATLEERVQQRTAALADANKELADTRAKLQGVLDAATELAIIAADANGVIQIFNTGAEIMLQYAAEEIEGICTPLLFHDPAECEQRARELSDEFARPMPGHEIFVAHARLGISLPHEWTYIRKDGSRLDVTLTVTAVRDAAGQIQGFLGIATDITQRKRLEGSLRLNNEQLVEQTRRAEEANRIKSDFLATMSHEIRTPMNAILGMADLLWESDMDAGQLHYVEVFRRAGANLLTLINEILDLSKIEAGQLEMECIEFDLEDVVKSAVELMGAKARGKGLALMSRLAPGVESALIGDPARLRQILINLLGNAVKFTDMGEVLLTVERPDPIRPGFLEFSISDTGIGIPADKLESIFEAFAQVDASITRRFGGTGLGLGISKKLVEQMGGEISATSSARGSTFRFGITFGVAPSGSRNSDADLADLNGKRVLILDDNATNRLILRETLGRWGLQSVEFEHPQDALTHLIGDRKFFSLVIVDNHMPEMNGFEAAARMKEAFPALPIVMLTSDNQPGDATRSRKAGLSGYAVKPVKRSDLFRLVCEALQKGQPARVADPSVAKGQSAVTGPSLAILIVEDSRDNRLLVEAYMKGTPHRLTFAEDGLEALRAFEAERFDMVLMDIQMPLMDGLVVTRAMRQMELEKAFIPTPILSLSANARSQDAAQSQAAGCTAHLSKPISKSRLLSAIELHANRVPRVTAGAIAVVIPDGLEELAAEYLRAQRSALPQALEMLAESEFEPLRMTAHNLKGTGASLGFDEISTIGAALEEAARDHDYGASARHVQALANYLERVEVPCVL